jgi:hypothetical protein
MGAAETGKPPMMRSLVHRGRTAAQANARQIAEVSEELSGRIAEAGGACARAGLGVPRRG